MTDLDCWLPTPNLDCWLPTPNLFQFIVQFLLIVLNFIIADYTSILYSAVFDNNIISIHTSMYSL